RTGDWRWLVPRSVPATSAIACAASGRVFDGPEPNRPSPGRSSGGMRIAVGSCAGGVGSLTGRSYGRPGSEPASEASLIRTFLTPVRWWAEQVSGRGELGEQGGLA